MNLFICNSIEFGQQRACLLDLIWKDLIDVFHHIKENQNLDNLKQILIRWNENLVNGFGEKIITPTLHEVIHHSVEFIEKYGDIQSFDESVCESTHHNQRIFFEHSPKKENMEEFILVDSFLYTQMMENLPSLNSKTSTNKAKQREKRKNNNYIDKLPIFLRNAEQISDSSNLISIEEVLAAENSNATIENQNIDIENNNNDDDILEEISGNFLKIL